MSCDFCAGPGRPRHRYGSTIIVWAIPTRATARPTCARREEEREEEWQLTRALFRRARDMLDYPLVVEVEQADGTKIQRPTNWRLADAARFIELAAKLARLAARMHDDDPTERALPETIFYIPDNGRPIRQLDDEAGDGPAY